MGRHCSQGFVNLYDVNEGDATLTILEGSDQHHADFYAHFGLDVKDDGSKLDQIEHQVFSCQSRFLDVEKTTPHFHQPTYDPR